MLGILLFLLGHLDFAVLSCHYLASEVLVGCGEGLAVHLFADFVQHQDEVHSLVEERAVLWQNLCVLLVLKPMFEDVVVDFLDVAVCADFLVFLQLRQSCTISTFFVLVWFSLASFVLLV